MNVFLYELTKCKTAKFPYFASRHIIKYIFLENNQTNGILIISTIYPDFSSEFT